MTESTQSPRRPFHAFLKEIVAHLAMLMTALVATVGSFHGINFALSSHVWQPPSSAPTSVPEGCKTDVWKKLWRITTNPAPKRGSIGVIGVYPGIRTTGGLETIAEPVLGRKIHFLLNKGDINEEAFNGQFKSEVFGSASHADIIACLELGQGEDAVDNAQRNLSAFIDDVRGTFSHSLRRIINGGIQFATVLIFFLGVIVLTREAWRVRKAPRELDSVVRKMSEKATGEASRLSLSVGLAADLMNTHGEVPDDAQQGESGSAVRGDVIVPDEDGPPRALARAFNVGLASGAVSATVEAWHREMENWRAVLGSRATAAGYAVWALPSIGFVGTVWGIGSALANAHQVMSAGGRSAQTVAVQALTGQLAVAFDTTLVALFLVLFLVLLQQFAHRWEDLVVDAVSSVVVDGVFSRLQDGRQAMALRDEISKGVRQIAGQVVGTTNAILVAEQLYKQRLEDEEEK